MDDHGKIFWHAAFFEALQLELYHYIDALKFINEYQLSKEALRMDVLVVKKEKGVWIDKNIGRIFKEHNIIEYKSESDSFSLWDYNRILGYAFLYSSYEQVPMSDITISVALTIFPRKLMKFLKNERMLNIQVMGDGIFYIVNEIVPIQILANKQLSPVSNLFLHNLRSNLSAEEMLNTLQSYRERKPLDDKNVYLDRLIKANLVVFKEALNMSETLKEIFLEGAEEYGWLDGKYVEKKRIEQIAKNLLLLGISVEKVSEVTELSIEEVTELL